MVKSSIGAVVAFIALISGCSLVGVSGSGAIVSEPRPVDAFSRIDASPGIELQIQIGPTQSVEVRAQSNILPLITTTNDGDTLRITVTSILSPSTEASVAIVVPSLDAVTLSGGSTATVDGLASSTLGVALSGGSVLNASGTVETVTINTSGGARANLRELEVATMVVEASGGSVVEAQVSGEVRGSASGGARVSVAGEAALNVEASGGANVERAE